MKILFTCFFFVSMPAMSKRVILLRLQIVAIAILRFEHPKSCSAFLFGMSSFGFSLACYKLLVFSGKRKEDGLFSAMFLCCSRVLLGLRGVKKFLVFWVVVLGFVLT